MSKPEPGLPSQQATSERRQLMDLREQSVLEVEVERGGGMGTTTARFLPNPDNGCLRIEVNGQPAFEINQVDTRDVYAHLARWWPPVDPMSHVTDAANLLDVAVAAPGTFLRGDPVIGKAIGQERTAVAGDTLVDDPADLYGPVAAKLAAIQSEIGCRLEPELHALMQEVRDAERRTKRAQQGTVSIQDVDDAVEDARAGALADLKAWDEILDSIKRLARS